MSKDYRHNRKSILTGSIEAVRDEIRRRRARYEKPETHRSERRAIARELNGMRLEAV